MNIDLIVEETIQDALAEWNKEIQYYETLFPTLVPIHKRMGSERFVRIAKKMEEIQNVR